MFEKLRRNPEGQTSKEVKAEEYFATADKYATLLLDQLGREEAVRAEIDTTIDGQRVGARVSVFRRIPTGFQIDYYLNSLQPIETAMLERISEDPDMGPQAFRASFINYRLPYDQLSYVDSKLFVDSLGIMFGEMPDLDLDEPYDRLA